MAKTGPANDVRHPRWRGRAAALIGAAMALATLATLGCGAEPPPRNVLLISVDTLRADRLGFAGYRRGVTPALDQLASEGVRFERSYSQAGWTLPSMATVLTGLYPGQHGATRAESKLRPDTPTLAATLADVGYQTRAIVSHGFLGKRFGLEKGFDSYDGSVLKMGDPHLGKTSVPVTDRAIAELESMESPFFLWVHYFDPHFDYLLHPEFEHLGTRPRQRYDGEIAYTDRQIGRLLQALTDLGLDDSTIVVFTADHGEEFREHDGIYHFSLYEEDVRIPLIIRVPGVAPRVETAVAEQIDIVPTLLELLGLPEIESLPGRPLMPPRGPDRPVFLERERPSPFLQQAAIDGNLKIIRVEVLEEVEDLEDRKQKTALRPGIQLFDLAADPRERNDLYREGDPESERLLELLELMADLPRSEGEHIGIDDETRQRLESLGYLD